MSESPATKEAVSVSGMARMVGLSRARLYQLMREGVFPSPSRQNETGRPSFDREQQEQCLQVRRMVTLQPFATEKAAGGRVCCPERAELFPLSRLGEADDPHDHPLLQTAEELPLLQTAEELLEQYGDSIAFRAIDLRLEYVEAPVIVDVHDLHGCSRVGFIQAVVLVAAHTGDGLIHKAAGASRYVLDVDQQPVVEARSLHPLVVDEVQVGAVVPV